MPAIWAIWFLPGAVLAMYSTVPALKLYEWTKGAVLNRAWTGAALTVGHDGLLLRRGGEERFIPFALLAERPCVPGPEDAGDWLVLKPEGESLTLRMLRLQPVIAEINQRLDAFEQRAESQPLPRLRVEKTAFDDWLDRWTHAAEAGYREVALSQARLLAVLQDVGAEPLERAAAAIALRGKTPNENKTVRSAIKHAADGSSHPALRRALRGIASGKLPAELEALWQVHEAALASDPDADTSIETSGEVSEARRHKA